MVSYISHWKKQKATKGIRKMKFKWYKIPLGTEVEIINKDSRYFRRKGILASPAPGGA